MRVSGTLFVLLATANSAIAATGEKVHVQIDKAVECERRTQKGDMILVHYRGTLKDGGKQFDASYDRGDPLSFIVGEGMVIKGWDENLLDMCIGDKRTLTIPPEFGYGSEEMGPIPASSTLIFETELVGIEGYEETKSADEKTVDEKPIDEKPIDEKPSESSTRKVIEKVIENAKAGLTNNLAKITKAAKTLLSDSDGDEQEHNEL